MKNSRLWKDPDDLIALAEWSEQPPPPPGGIPRQRLPGWVRWPIRVLMLPFVLLDLAAQRIARLFFKTPYKTEGHCHQRGNCCYYIGTPAPNNLMTRLYYLWNTEVNGFYSRGFEPMDVDGKLMVIMGCRYLLKDGRCGQYRLRPMVCRQWPRIEIFGKPRRLKGCGFKAVPRDKNFDPYGEVPSSLSNKLNIID